MNMNKEEFLKTATAKIYNFKQKQKIKAELIDHIETKKEFFMEIGYNQETSEAKAISTMGDAEEICNDLSKLYNSFYNPAPDIITYCIWFGILGILYLIFDRYIFNDLGTTALCAGAVTFSTALLCIYSAISIIKKQKLLVIGNLIGSFANAVFNLLCIASINKNTGTDISAFTSYVFGNSVPASQNTKYSISVLICTIIILLISVATQIPIFIMLNKTANFENTKSTNNALKIFKKVSIISAVILVAITSIFTARFFACRENIKRQCTENIELTLEIAENCSNLSEVPSYLAEHNYSFKEINSNGNVEGYIFSNSISEILITLNNDDAKKEEKHGLERIAAIFENRIKSKYPESFEQKNEYYIQFSLINLAKYKNGSDSISLTLLKTPEEELDILYNFEASEIHSYQDIAYAIKNTCPTSVYILPSKDKSTFDSQVKLTCSTGYGDNSYNTDYNLVIESEKKGKIKKQKESIVEILTNSPDISKEELANATGATIINPKYSQSDIKKNITMMQELLKDNESYKELLADVEESDYDFDEMIDDLIESYYESMYIYEISDDLTFKITRSSEDDKTSIFIYFDSKTNVDFVSIDVINDEEDSDYFASYYGNFRKIHVKEKGYFSMKGYAYSDYQNIPYYTKSGSRYRFVVETNEKGYELYYLKNIHGDKHETYDCYTDKDGYLVFDDDKKFRSKISESDLEITEYTDDKQNIYIKALETNWDSDGSLLDYNKYYKK